MQRLRSGKLQRRRRTGSRRVDRHALPLLPPPPLSSSSFLFYRHHCTTITTVSSYLTVVVSSYSQALAEMLEPLVSAVASSDVLESFELASCGLGAPRATLTEYEMHPPLPSHTATR
eukprot:COSAG05_NODE_1286_length_5278_cov_4.428461_4_plen_117_part_00